MEQDILKRGTPRHPKLYEALRLSGIPMRYEAAIVGHLELLWHFTAEFAPHGDIGKFSDERIEAALRWHGARGKLIEVLIQAGWIDQNDIHRLVVHDWMDHCEDSTRKKLNRAIQSNLQDNGKMTGKCPAVSGQPEPEPMPEPLPLPKPEPLPLPKPEPLPLPKPEPEPVLQPLNFPDWLRPWPRCASPDEAARAWISTVTSEADEAAAFAARDRYLNSAEVADGAIMEPAKFLYTQKRNNWSGKWPIRIERKSGRRSTSEVIAERIAKGEAPW